jgi:hypothetical protein
MLSRLLAVRALAVSVFAFASVSSAATLDLTGAVGSTIATGSAGVVTYNGSAAFGPVTFVASPRGSDLTWSSGNGLGINCPSSIADCSTDAAYQIDTPEFLSVNFGNANGVYLTSIDIGLLNTTGRCYLRIDETGSVLGDGFDIGFDSDDATNGKLTVQVNRWVTSLSFVPDRGEWNDFTLARLRISDGVPSPGNPIPEPSSVLLMLVGGAIVATELRARI